MHYSVYMYIKKMYFFFHPAYLNPVGKASMLILWKVVSIRMGS